MTSTGTFMSSPRPRALQGLDQGLSRVRARGQRAILKGSDSSPAPHRLSALSESLTRPL